MPKLSTKNTKTRKKLVQTGQS